MTDKNAAPLRAVSVVLSASTALQVLVSFALQWYVVAHFGLGERADAFYAGCTLSQIICVVVIDSLPLVLVPMLSNATAEEFQTEVWRTLVAFLILLGLLSAVLAAAASMLIPILVPGFSAANKVLTTEMTRIQLLGVTGAGVTAVLTSAWQARRRFVQPALAVLGSSLAALGVMAYTLRVGGGIQTAAWAQVIAATGPALLLFPVLRWPDSAVSNRTAVVVLWLRLRPVIAGKVCFVASGPLDRLLLSFLPAGTMVIFELVSRFYSAVQRVLAQGVLTPILPELSRLAGKGLWEEFRALGRKQSWVILFLSVAVFAGTELTVLILLPVARHLTGALPQLDTARLAVMIALLGGALPCLSLAAALTNSFYAQGDTVTPARIAVVAYVAGIALRPVGFYAAGISGICVAVTLWTVIQCVLLHRALEKRASKQLCNAIVTQEAALAVAEGN